MSGIYIHIPFCKQACHYCDFHFSTSMKKKDVMIAALKKELELRKDEFKEELVETIYFGGGTPSVLEVQEIEQIITTVYSSYAVSDHAEITLEANPDDLTNDRIVQFSEGRINRLSIGIQSFFEEDLKLMNRAHSAHDAEVCIQQATRYFENISIDLIYGMPKMGNDRWLANIEKALSYHIPHISSYALTVEPKTALASFIKKGIIEPMDDQVAQDHFNILLDSMEANGYVSYEISNFGKPGYFSRNNTAYWQGKKYIGIGPSAHSYDGNRRAWNSSNNSKYIASIESNVLPMEIEVLSKTDKYNEYVMTGLRTIWGVSLERIRDEFGVNYHRYLLQQADKYVQENLLFIDGDKLLTTRKGRFLADGIAADLFMVILK
ncbi:MAG: radical SAM family heme chaperone HemW [Flavobacteriaceae bacterium]